MTEEVQAPLAESAMPVSTNSNPDLRWYVVHAYSGMEKAVERNILERISRSGMQDKFGRILVPMEEVVEVKNGQKKTTERKFFPGYVLVEMVMDDDTWHLVKHTNKVTGFVGGAKNRPAPISESEVQKIVSQMRTLESLPMDQGMQTERKLAKASRKTWIDVFREAREVVVLGVAGHWV